jgi:hypothetical protein
VSAKRNAPEPDAPKTFIKKVDPKAAPDFDRFCVNKLEAGHAA